MIPVIFKIITAILAFVLPYLYGYFVISLIERSMALRFRVLFAIPLGFGLSSILYFVYLCCNFNSFKFYAFFEIALLIVLALFYYNEEKPDLSKHKFKKLSHWFYVLNFYAVLIYLKYFLINPMGSWDGFRIWNIKAEFLSLDTPLWRSVFELPHFMSHNDYPMFLPSSIARIWEYLGGQNFYANAVFGLIFTFGIVYLLYQAVAYFKSEKAAIVVASIFMISDIFLVNGASQCADVPLSYFFLSAIVCLFMFFKKEQISYVAMGVIFAGMSAWVKNEGMMFFLIYSVVILGYFLFTKKYKNALISALCALPFVAFAFVYKKMTGTENDLIMGFFLFKTWRFAFDFQRYLLILKTFVSMLFLKFSIFFALLLLTVKGFRVKEKNEAAFCLSVLILALTAVGYIVVYVFSPHDLKWILDNSMDRIILQILPVFLFLFSVNLRIGKPDTVN